MTATERLRALLDERGVEWRKTPHYSSESQDNETVFEGNGIEWYANDHLNGRLGLRAVRYEVTPEQAIAATLGPEDAYTREDVESAFVSGYSLGSLPVGSDPQWDQNEQTVDEHMAELGWVRKDAATLGETPTPPPPTMPKQPPYDLLIDLLRDEWGIDASWDGLRRFWYVCLNEKGMRMRDEREVATLGPGTCRALDGESSSGAPLQAGDYDEFWEPAGVCSECGELIPLRNYCPNCGKRVVG